MRTIVGESELRLRRVLRSLAEHSGLDSVMFVLGHSFETVLGGCRLEVRLANAGLKSEVKEMREQEIDILLSGMWRRGIDQDEGSETVGRRLEDV